MISIVVPGDFYDGYLYAGKLFVFSGNGDLHILDWDAFVAELAISRNNRPLNGHFGDNRLQQNYDSIGTENSPSSSLGSDLIEVTWNDLSRHSIRSLESPLPFPHAHIHFYKFDLYSAGPSGVHCARQIGDEYGGTVQKLFDGPIGHLEAKWSRLAMAAGSDGVLEAPAANGMSRRRPNPTTILADHSTQVGFMFYSIVSSSVVGRSHLIRFTDVRVGDDVWERRRIGTDQSTIGRDVDAQFSVGSYDRLCHITDSASFVVDRVFEARNEPDRNPLAWTTPRTVERLPLRNTGSPIAGTVAPFGIVMEFDNTLVSVTDDGFYGEYAPVNWHTFPRALRYFGQMVVVGEKALEIRSYSQELLRRSARKSLGTTPPRPADLDVIER